MPWPAADRVVLVGSGMGGYVSAVATCARPVHGCGDEVIPWQHSTRFAAARRGTLEWLFAGFLRWLRS